MTMYMQRLAPIHEFRKMDEVFNRMWQDAGNGHLEQRWQVPIDVIQSDDSIVLHAALPGIAPDDISVTIQNGTLTISAEYEENSGDGYLIRERRTGKFHRALHLPKSVDADNVDTQYRHGVLSLTFPKAEAEKPRRLEIKVE